MFLVTQIVGRIMLRQGSGKIINISSSGRRTLSERICYCASKAAVIHMTQGLAVEWAMRGVTVNSIAPGVSDMYPDSKDEKYLQMNEVRKKTIPVGCLGRLEELGCLAIYLASDASGFITGETMAIGGGRTAA